MTTMSDEQKVKSIMIVAGGVICKKGKNGETMVLLIQRSRNDHWPLHWEFPRGKCDKPIGEPPDKCALREIKEETGLDVKIVKFLNKYIYLADKGTRKSICYNFLCVMKDPDQKIKLSNEHEAYRWITQLGEADLMVLPDQRKTLELVLNVNPIVNTPENSFTDNNKLAEYLDYLQKAK